MRLEDFFEPEDTPERLNVGLRMFKTAIAVFISAIIGFLRGQVAIFSMIASIICLQNNPEKTLIMSLNQAMGSIIGGAVGVGAIYFAKWTGLLKVLPLYYLFVALLLIPVMLLTLLVRKPSISAFTCIVFIGVATVNTTGQNLFLPALQRVLDTMIGVVTAYIVNVTIPHNKLAVLGHRTTKRAAESREKANPAGMISEENGEKDQ